MASSAEPLIAKSSAKKPAIIVFQTVTKVFVMLAALALITQYLFRLFEVLQHSKAEKAVTWGTVKVCIISCINILVGVLLSLIIWIPDRGSVRKGCSRKFRYLYSPAKLGVLLVYMTIVQAPGVLFQTADTNTTVQSSMIVIVLACAAVVESYACLTLCNDASVRYYLQAQGKVVPEGYRIAL